MLAILSTHPIQYQVPLWQALAKDGRVPFEVWYLSDHGTRATLDREFNQSFAWDLDTLSGYPSRFLKTNRNHDVSRFSQLRLAESLGKMMTEKKVRALWIQGWQVAAYWQAVWQANAAEVPVWLRGESNDLPPTSTWKKPIKQVAMRQLFSRISKFLYIGKANRRLYERYGVSEDQLHPAYYCVDNERFRQQAEELRPRRAELRRQWGIADDSFCVLFAGKFIPKKRPMDLVDAVTRLHNNGSNQPFHLMFAGSGEMGDQIRASCNVIYDQEANNNTVARENGKPRASFTGFLNQTEISGAYVAADCLVLPSDHRETWGLVVNEAMASGLPCIASDACGCTEDLITPVASELGFPFGSVEGLSVALQHAMRQRPGASVLWSMINRYDVAASVATTQSLYGKADREALNLLPINNVQAS